MRNYELIFAFKLKTYQENIKLHSEQETELTVKKEGRK